jgi:hypothetical protein
MPDYVQIIPPGIFMMLGDVDLLEDEPTGYEQTNTVTQISHAGHPPHLHPRSASYDSLKYLSRTLSGKNFEVSASERKRSSRRPNKSPILYQGISSPRESYK